MTYDRAGNAYPFAILGDEPKNVRALCRTREEGESFARSLVGTAIVVDRSEPAERDATETRLQDGLGAFMQAHARHNHVPGVSIGVEFYRDGEAERLPRSLHRQAVACAECAACYVGPSYAWLNRGVTLTAFGRKVVELSAEAR